MWIPIAAALLLVVLGLAVVDQRRSARGQRRKVRMVTSADLYEAARRAKAKSFGEFVERERSR